MNSINDNVTPLRDDEYVMFKNRRLATVQTLCLQWIRIKQIDGKG